MGSLAHQVTNLNVVEKNIASGDNYLPVGCENVTEYLFIYFCDISIKRMEWKGNNIEQLIIFIKWLSIDQL